MKGTRLQRKEQVGEGRISMRTWQVIVAGLIWAPTILAQQERQDPAGSVFGQVMCSDTQRPARLAQVMLVGAPTEASVKTHPAGPTGGDGAASGNPVDSSLDGSYVIHHVRPGRYYVVVNLEGYLIPLEQFSAEDLASTDARTRTRVLKAVHTITLTGDDTVREDVVLDRGASVSETITYDDGTPASGLGINLLVKDKDGKWQPMHNGRLSPELRDDG